MSGITYYWMAAIGICFLFKYATILNKFREYTISKFPFLKELYKCCLCMGFWAGILMAPILFLTGNVSLELLLFPFTTAATSWLGDHIIRLLDNLNLHFSSDQNEMQQQAPPPKPPHPLSTANYTQTSKGSMPNVPNNK